MTFHRATIITSAALLALPLAGGCSGSHSDPGSTSSDAPVVTAPSPANQAIPASHKEWHRLMTKKPTPRGGCFKATHPSTTWEEVPCVAAPSVPLVPSRAGAGTPALQVGNGAGDYASTVSGTISYAEGSFPYASGLTKEIGLAPGINLPGSYSLQMNTNTASGTAACAQGPNAAGCTAWQQFVYLGDALFLQYWLINYFAAAPNGASCPSGFSSYDNGYYVGTTIKHQYDCYVSSSSAANVPSFPAADLPYIAMAADVSSGDQVTLYYFGQIMAISPSEGSVLHVNQWWNSAEFNVFGPGYGSAAVFNYGTTMAVETITDSRVPTLAAPSCTSTSYTGEINNLSAVAGSCCALGGVGTGTGVFFTQSNVAGAGAVACP